MLFQNTAAMVAIKKLTIIYKSFEGFCKSINWL